MAQTKNYPATKQQANTIINKIDAVDAKIEPIDLASVDVKVLDFLNDPMTIISGGLDSLERTISN